MQEGLAKESVASEDGRGRAQGDGTTEVNPANVHPGTDRSVRISVQRNHKPQAPRGEQPGNGPAEPESGMGTLQRPAQMEGLKGRTLTPTPLPQLQLVYREAFSNFKNVSGPLFR